MRNALTRLKYVRKRKKSLKNFETETSLKNLKPALPHKLVVL